MKTVECVDLSPTVTNSAAAGQVLLFTEQGLQEAELCFEVLVLAVLLCHRSTVLLLANPVEAKPTKMQQNSVRRICRSFHKQWIVPPLLPYSDSFYSVYCNPKHGGLTCIVSRTCTVQIYFCLFPELSVLHYRQVSVHYTDVSLQWDFLWMSFVFHMALLKTKCSRFNKRENKT